jgi:predicted nucleotidyltransferase
VIAGESWDRNVECNETILKRKRDYLARHGIYIEVSDHPTEFVEYYRKLVENRA